MPAPRFCAVKLETPLPSVVSEVITRLLSLTEAEYPAMVAVPKPLMTLRITILPTEMKLCCRMLGMATVAILPSSRHENTGAFSGVSNRRNRRRTNIIASTQLPP